MVSPTKAKPTDVPPNERVAVVTTGIADDPRCISDLEAFAGAILKPIKKIHSTLSLGGNRIREIIVAGPPCLAKTLDQLTSTPVSATFIQRNYTRFLDDAADEGDGYSIPSVIGSEPTMGQVLVAMGRIPISKAATYDLNNAADRAVISNDVIWRLDPGRYQRAKQKSQCKRLEYMTNDWFDRLPDVDHVVIVNDGNTPHQHVINHANGTGQWVKYPTGASGEVESITLSTNCLSWTQAAVFDPRYRRNINFEQLTYDEQKQILQWLTEREREMLEFPRTPTQPAPAETTTTGNKTAAIG